MNRNISGSSGSSRNPLGLSSISSSVPFARNSSSKTPSGFHRDAFRDLVARSRKGDPTHEHFKHVARFLLDSKIDKIPAHELPATLKVPECEMTCPFHHQAFIQSITVTKMSQKGKGSAHLKRSHTVEIQPTRGEAKTFLFKQFDDGVLIEEGMVALIKRANHLWQNTIRNRGVLANNLGTNSPLFRCPTYLASACDEVEKNCGFTEYVEGEPLPEVGTDLFMDTLLHVDGAWNKFTESSTAITVLCAAFSIEDRRPKNAIWTGNGDITLVELTSALNCKLGSADSTFRVNPAFSLAHVVKFRELIVGDVQEKWMQNVGFLPPTVHELEQILMTGYFYLYNSDVRSDLEKCGFGMPEPYQFFTWVKEKQTFRSTLKDSMRDTLVTVDRDEVFTKFIGKMKGLGK